MAHPTWVETQNVMRGVSGMNTASTRRPSARRRSSLAVPSADRSARSTVGVEQAQSPARVARRAAGRSVIRSKSVTPRR